MGTSTVPDLHWPELSERIAELLGLHYPPERWADLERGLAAVAEELNLGNLAECADWLLSKPLLKSEIQALACHLTIGETYFFRDQQTFTALSDRILPELIQSRTKSGQRLRIWSAGCCTGEEAYSLAILLDQLLANTAARKVNILATDINPAFLKTASAGVFGDWSFRGTPAWIKDRYFQPTGDRRYEILPEITELVTFAPLNLVEDFYPALESGTNAMDLIFCRNVLMYFTPEQIEKVLRHLRRTLVDDGYLVVSASEATHPQRCGFEPIQFQDAIVYRKSPATMRPITPVPVSPMVEPWEMIPRIVEPAVEPVVEIPIDELPPQLSFDPSQFAIDARRLANEGKLTEALEACERWIASDKLESTGYYLRAMILQEIGNAEEGRSSLQRALYLQPDFILAHFALANAGRSSGRNEEANRHWKALTWLLSQRQPDEVVPESDGLTVQRLSEIVSTLMTMDQPQ